MPELEDREPEGTAAEEVEEIEVVAHSDEEDDELNAGCTFNSSAAL